MAAILEAEAKVTSQNQISIPAAIRKAMSLQPGKSLFFRIFSDGKIVVSAKTAQAAKEDPALRPFLALLEKDIKARPERIKPFPPGLLARARALARGVRVNLDGPLTGQD